MWNPNYVSSIAALGFISSEFIRTVKQFLAKIVGMQNKKKEFLDLEWLASLSAKPSLFAASA